MRLLLTLCGIGICSLLQPHTALAEGTTFLPPDASRTPSQVIEAFSDDSNRASEPFFRALMLNHNLESKAHVLRELQSNAEVIPCGNGAVTTSRLNASGGIEYFIRPCKLGEHLVYLNGKPAYSTHCGNPVQVHYRGVLEFTPKTEQATELVEVCEFIDEYKTTASHDTSSLAVGDSFVNGFGAYAVGLHNNSFITTTGSGGRNKCRLVPLQGE